MPIGWIALVASAYLAFTAALFPASIAYRWFAPDDIRLSGVQGTVWSGQAALGSAGALGLNDIRWQARPWSFLLARPGAHVEASLGNGFLRADIGVGANEIVVSGLTASFSVSALEAVIPVGAIRGELSVLLDEMVLVGNWPVSATGELRLGQLTVPSLLGGESFNLGNYVVTLSGSDGLHGEFEDRGGPLQVRGSVELSPEGGYEFQGFVQTRPEAAVELTRGLELMTGVPDETGMRPFSFTGTI